MIKKNFSKNRYFYEEYKTLIKRIQKKINSFSSRSYKPDYDIPIYFPSYYNGQGLYFIKKTLGLPNNFFVVFYYTLKDFLYSSNYNDIKLINNKKILSEKTISTWAYKKNFKNNGSLNEDINFNINSRQLKNTHWIVLYLDKNLPKKVDENITLIQIIKNKKFKFFLLLKILIYNFKYLFIDYRYFLFSISSHNFLSNKILNIFKKIISKPVKKFLITYEAQPFQNRIIQYLKNKNIKTLGHISQAPLALPTHLIKKKYSPSKMFVNGIDQKDCLIKLGWKKKNIITIPSTRFLDIKKNFSNQIFFPGSIKSVSQILKSLEFLIINHKLNLKKFSIRNHPAVFNSKTHKTLEFRINKLKKKYKSNFKNNSFLNNYSIFIGASGSIIEALERNCKVIQITEVPILDFYSNYFWKSVKAKKINDNIFTYSLTKKKNLIIFGKKPKNLNMFFNHSDI
jgi:hypothetical protein